MKPFYVLIVTFAISLLTIFVVTDLSDWRLAGRIAMSVMLLFTAIGHFIYSRGMEMMIPAAIPFKTGLVLTSGLFEIAAAICLLIPQYTRPTGIILIVFFLLILPANIHAARRGLNYQTGKFDGPGKGYLKLRVPLQILFILWVYFAAVNS